MGYGRTTSRLRWNIASLRLHTTKEVILECRQLSPPQLHSPHVRFVGPASGRGTSKRWPYFLSPWYFLSPREALPGGISAVFVQPFCGCVSPKLKKPSQHWRLKITTKGLTWDRRRDARRPPAVEDRDLCCHQQGRLVARGLSSSHRMYLSISSGP